MTDLLQRLEAADPCPVPVVYDDAVAQRNIEAIVRTDLTVGPVVPARRSHRPAWLAVAAAVVVLAVGGSVVGVEISREAAPAVLPAGSSPVPAPFSPSGSVAAVPFTTFSQQGLTFVHPTAWTSYPAGVVTTMSEPLAYLSTTAFAPLCATGTTGAGGTMTACHPPEPDLRPGGVFVDWTEDYTPARDLLDGYRGRATVLAGHDAKIDTSTLPLECTPTGAVTGVLAAIATGSGVLSMTACVGPGDVDADLAAVDQMLASLQIDR